MPDKRSDDLIGHRGYLSFGSNVGERETAVLEAVRLVEDIEGIEAGRCGSLYETEPVEGVEGGFFINTVLEVHSLHQPDDLLLRLKSIERKMGRSGGHNKAREIDIDIITLGENVLQGEALTIPHPRYTGRAFVLLPLREVAPGFRCPRTGRHINDLIEALPAGQETNLVSTRWAHWI